MSLICQDVYEMINALLDGECTKEEETLVKEHLLVCRKCSNLLASLDCNAQLLRKATPAISDDLHARLHAIALPKPKEKKTFAAILRMPSVRVSGFIAACLAVCVSVGAGVHYYQQLQNAQNAQKSGMPAHSGMLYDKSEQSNWGLASLLMPNSMTFSSFGEGNWATDAQDEDAWCLRLHESGAVELYTGDLHYVGTAVLDQTGNLIAIRFNSFSYIVTVEDGYMVLTKEGT
ncbi:MAG: zf-HC2 domain-containing protein [Clostridia bacterium]|nr:zf-HC2 domain-containing protein [Clostridia bacterium]